MLQLQTEKAQRAVTGWNNGASFSPAFIRKCAQESKHTYICVKINGFPVSDLFFREVWSCVYETVTCSEKVNKFKGNQAAVWRNISIFRQISLFLHEH